VGRDGGATLQALLGRVRETLDTKEGGDALAEARALLEAALGDVEAIFMTMLGKVQEHVDHVGLQGNRVLHAVAEIVIGWLLVRHAAVALRRRDAASEDDRAFYDGKVASAQWFCREVLPGLAHTRRMIEASRLDLTQLPESAF
jgi:hypothetical protein